MRRILREVRAGAFTREADRRRRGRLSPAEGVARRGRRASDRGRCAGASPTCRGRMMMKPLLCRRSSCSPPAAPRRGNAAQNEAEPPGPATLAAAGRYRGMRAGPTSSSQLELRPRRPVPLRHRRGRARRAGRRALDQRRPHRDPQHRAAPHSARPSPPARSRAASEHPLVDPRQRPERATASPRIDVRVGLADGRVLEGYTQDYGWQPGEGEAVGDAGAGSSFRLDIHGVPPRRFALDAAAGNVFTFTLVPNDLGVADFRDTDARDHARGAEPSPFRGRSAAYGSRRELTPRKRE